MLRVLVLVIEVFGWGRWGKRSGGLGDGVAFEN